MLDKDKFDALTRLAGAVSHELNNIFTAVNGNLSLLEMASVPAGLNAQLITDVLNTTRRGMELSEKLQAFAGRQKLQYVCMDLNAITTSAIADMKNTLLNGVEVELVLSREPCLISVDEKNLRHVIEELIGNAVAAMKHGGWVAIATGHQMVASGQTGSLTAGEYITLEIKDAGEGMSPDVARHALDPLFSTKPGHHGWGLARSVGFIRQCGGDITLNSVPDKGTAVVVYLPRKRMDRSSEGSHTIKSYSR